MGGYYAVITNSTDITGRIHYSTDCLPKNSNPPVISCSAWGDPHYTGFNGGVFHYQGKCDHLLTSISRPNDNLAIYGRNYPCLSGVVTCFGSLGFRINNESVFEFHVSYSNKLFLRGGGSLALPYFDPQRRFIIREVSSLNGNQTLIEFDDGISIQFARDIFQINLPAQIYSSKLNGGVCGTASSFVSNTGVSTDGITSAISWEVINNSPFTIQNIFSPCNPNSNNRNLVVYTDTLKRHIETRAVVVDPIVKNSLETLNYKEYCSVLPQAYDYCSQLFTGKLWKSCAQYIDISDAYTSCVVDYCAAGSEIIASASDPLSYLRSICLDNAVSATSITQLGSCCNIFGCSNNRIQSSCDGRWTVNGTCSSETCNTAELGSCCSPAGFCIDSVFNNDWNENIEYCDDDNKIG